MAKDPICDMEIDEKRLKFKSQWRQNILFLLQRM